MSCFFDILNCYKPIEEHVQHRTAIGCSGFNPLFYDKICKPIAELFML